MRFRLKPIALSVLCAFAPAAYGADEPLILKLDRTFNVLPETQDATPAFINARHIEGKTENQIEATGDAELRKHGQAIFADRLLYLQDTQDVIADGSVRVEQGRDVITGPHLKLNMDTNIGDMPQPKFFFGENNSRGSADSLHMAGKKNYTLKNVTYTSCPAGDDDWLLKMSQLDIDRDTQIGEASGTLIEFKGVPILYTPWMDFALNDNRKSGFLSPVFGSTTTGGSEIILPYYWNIAPNRDATIAPQVLTKRGLMLSNQFRYLEPTYSGEADFNILPNDRIANSTRSMIFLKHLQNFGNGFSSSINYTGVSDDTYFRDLSSSIITTSQVNLLRQGAVNYSGGWWNASAVVQRYQTLQDPSAPIVPPYRLLPQLTLNAQHKLDGADTVLTTQYTDFSHPTEVNGQRMVIYPSASYKLINDPGYYLTPKIGLNYTSYVLGNNNTQTLPNATRTLPIFSVDSGATFERELNFSGMNLTQTLEPRLYYVYIPYQNQNSLPIFDSGLPTLSLAQLFTENRFLGYDRIGDANEVTAAVTSRFMNSENGIERLRTVVGERFSLASPQVNLVSVQPGTAPPPTTPIPSKSDILLGVSGRITKELSLDTLLQYNPVGTAQTDLFNATARYMPESGKVFNLGYNYSRGSLEQITTSAQWPVYHHWDAVAQMNYSLMSGALVNGMAGLEYNETCWTVRIVAQRFATTVQQVSTGFFIQLELNDLIRVGSDPLTALRQYIPGYTKLNQNSNENTVQGLR